MSSRPVRPSSRTSSRTCRSRRPAPSRRCRRRWRSSWGRTDWSRSSCSSASASRRPGSARWPTRGCRRSSSRGGSATTGRDSVASRSTRSSASTSWPRRSCPSTASCRSSPSAAETARPASGRSPRTRTATASCAVSRSPAVAAPQAEAEELVRRLLEELDYVGVLALELFEVDGRLLANEFAPRVHNTGHWTIDGAVTSQFENHLRAILGLPLGSTDAVAPSGDAEPDRRRACVGEAAGASGRAPAPLRQGTAARAGRSATSR